MEVVTGIVIAAIVGMVVITVLKAVCSHTCPDCGGVLEWQENARMSERYKCTHCGAKWWYHQINGR
jgi:predicted RNA-binding Zn-ribbon protein involved in translation (DUF1610 family)